MDATNTCRMTDALRGVIEGLLNDAQSNQQLSKDKFLPARTRDRYWYESEAGEYAAEVLKAAAHLPDDMVERLSGLGPEYAALAKAIHDLLY